VGIPGIPGGKIPLLISTWWKYQGYQGEVLLYRSLPGGNTRDTKGE